MDISTSEQYQKFLAHATALELDDPDLFERLSQETMHKLSLTKLNEQASDKQITVG